ncbi:MAG: DNA-protecting protein DprA [Rickettsia sp.]|nr:DNA-protecting protein DprA [Rickettsia sp.]
MVKDFYSEEDINILRLFRSENIGSRTYQQLINIFKSPKIILQNIGDFSSKWRKSPLKICSKKVILEEIEKAQKYDCSIITYKDISYPESLLEIHNFPIALTCRGKISLLKKKQKIAVVGSRNSSVNGKIFTKKLVQDLIDENFTTVSGLALGIDAQVHQASINNTIAVLAGGIDHIYPYANKSLYDIISKKSLIITELPFGTKATGKNFPQRNRIISGLALGSVIIEASTHSGSLITARFALEQNREVFAVPGFPLDMRSSGTNKLIKNNEAFLIESIEDIMSNIRLEKKVREIPKPTFLNKVDLDTIEEKDRKKILSILSSTPVSYEEIYKETKIPMQIIYTICLELELAGKIYVDEISNRISILFN